MAEKLPAKRITEAQARKATDHIKEAIVDAWRLLTEAHDDELWKILGYESFGDYAETEFDMTPGNAYRLVTQGHVVAALEEASQSALPPGSVSAREANELKRELEEVAEALRIATEGKGEAERAAAMQGELARLRLERAEAATEAQRLKEEEAQKSRARESEEREEQARRVEADRVAAESTAGEGIEPLGGAAHVTDKPATQLSLFEEREGRELLPDRPPLNQAEADEAVLVGRELCDWADLYEDPNEPPPTPVLKKKTPVKKAKAPKAPPCVHPIGRRDHEGRCFICFEKVGKK